MSKTPRIKVIKSASLPEGTEESSLAEGPPSAVMEEPSDETIDQLVGELRELQIGATLDLALRVGKLIIDRIYGGDASKLQDRDPQKEGSLRKLANREDLPFGASTLFRSIGVFILTQRLGDVSARKHLTLTHYRAVLGLPFKEQEKLLDKAEHERWDTRKLEDQAHARRRNESGGGRPPLPDMVKIVRALDSTLHKKQDQWGALEDLSADLEPEEAREIYEKVDKLRATFEALEKRLKPMLEAPIEVEAEDVGVRKQKTAISPKRERSAKTAKTTRRKTVTRKR